VLISLIAQSFSRLKRRRGAYLSFLSQSAFFFATTRHGWKALTAQQQQIHRVLWSGFCGQVRILWSDGTFTVIRGVKTTPMVQGWDFSGTDELTPSVLSCMIGWNLRNQAQQEASPPDCTTSYINLS
jgi:hypothetical protein